jgi:hypothetical protein
MSRKSLALGFYAGSIACPYVLALLIPHPVGYGFSVLLPDFLALCTLLICSIILWADPYYQGGRWRYPLGAIAAVVLYFQLAPNLRRASDYVSLKRKQRGLEQVVETFRQRTPALAGVAIEQVAEQQKVRLAALGIKRVERAQPGVVLFVEDEEASLNCWGVAYSGSGQKPAKAYMTHELEYWRHLEGPWYKWSRSDN